jgi:hypothetical protein
MEMGEGNWGWPVPQDPREDVGVRYKCLLVILGAPRVATKDGMRGFPWMTEHDTMGSWACEDGTSGGHLP